MKARKPGYILQKGGRVAKIDLARHEHGPISGGERSLLLETKDYLFGIFG